MRNRPNLPYQLGLVLITMIWGGTFVMVQKSLDHVDVFTFTAWRFFIATAILALIFHRELRHINRIEIIGGALTGLALGTGYIFQTIGLGMTTTSKTAFITGLSVVFIPILAAVLIKQKPGRGAVIGVAVATVGLGLLSLDRNLQIDPGDLWVLMGAISFAFQIVGVAFFADRVNPIRLAITQVGAVGVEGMIASLLLATPRIDLPLETWGAIIFTGLFATALAFSFQIRAQRVVPPTQVALIYSLEPVFGAFFGWLLAGERLGLKALIGCGLILAGMLLSELHESGE